MSSHATNGRTPVTTTRPTLPYAQINPHLALPDNAKLPTVKYQVIMRDGQEIIVGRVKIQTPNGGHAFVLRRFDTSAISQTTMFRAAFPTAPEELEKAESNWVKANHDSTGANGGAGTGRDTLRLAGVWVRPEVAKSLAPDYSLDHIIEPLLNAHPDPSQEYRRSTKPSGPQANGIVASSSPVKPPSSSSQAKMEIGAPPSSPPGSPKPAKRRKESAQVQMQMQPMMAAVMSSPKKSSTLLDALAPPVATPRRSGRTTSPVPVPAPIPVPSNAPATPAGRTTRTRIVKETKVTNTVKSMKKGRQLTPEEEEEYEEADVPGPSMKEDVEEQKELIAKLKAEREHAQSSAAASTATTSAVPLVKSDSQSSKRSRESDAPEPLKFHFRESGGEEGDEGEGENKVAKREIRSNRRISLDLEPQQKSAAWGALWFAAGLAAAATIPTFFM